MGLKGLCGTKDGDSFSLVWASTTSKLFLQLPSVLQPMISWSHGLTFPPSRGGERSLADKESWVYWLEPGCKSWTDLITYARKNFSAHKHGECEWTPSTDEYNTSTVIRFEVPWNMYVHSSLYSRLLRQNRAVLLHCWSCDIHVWLYIDQRKLSSRAVERRPAFAFPTLWLIICVLDAKVASNRGHLDGYTGDATVTLMITVGGSWPQFVHSSSIARLWCRLWIFS